MTWGHEVSVTDFLSHYPLLSPQPCEAGILTEVRLAFKAPGSLTMHYLSLIITASEKVRPNNTLRSAKGTKGT